MNLTWGTCGDSGSWCDFLTVNLDHSYFDMRKGVYIIWKAKGPVIKIGQGIIKDRLSVHRNDEAIISYNNLFVTWASVSVQNRDGVERYLADRLKPRLGDIFPDVVPIKVNLPWSY